MVEQDDSQKAFLDGVEDVLMVFKKPEHLFGYGEVHFPVQVLSLDGIFINQILAYRSMKIVQNRRPLESFDFDGNLFSP